MPPRNVVLIGFMGAGKSSVAAALAPLLGFDAVDTDAMIEREAGASVAELFARDGEAAFRAREADVVERVAKGEGQVIACGGGAILHVKNLQALQDAGPIVFLRASAESILERIGASAASRPLLRGDPAATVPALLAERTAAYRAAADLIVDTDGRAPADLAAEIAKALA